MASVSTTNLEKAVLSLIDSIGLYKDATDSSPAQLAFRDSCIQRFEYGIELSWKTSVKVLGLQTTAARPAIREMAQNGLIEDPQIWFDFLEARNNSSHSYDEDIANKVLKQALLFPIEAQKLIEKLKIND